MQNIDTIFTINIKENNYTFLGLSYEVLITLSISISIFILGYIANHYYYKFKNNRRLRIVNKYVLRQIKELLATTKISIDNVKSILEKVKSFDAKSLNHIHSVNSEISDLFEIGLEESYNSLINCNKGKWNEKIENFVDLRSVLYFIKELNKQIEDNIIEYIQNLNVSIDGWNDGLENIKNVKASLITENTKNKIIPDDDKLLKQIFELDLLVSKAGVHKDIIQMHNMLILGMIEILKNNGSDERIYHFYFGIEKCKNSIEKLQHVKAIYSQIFENKFLVYSEQFVKLANIYKYFSNLKYKFFNNF